MCDRIGAAIDASANACTTICRSAMLLATCCAHLDAARLIGRTSTVLDAQRGVTPMVIISVPVGPPYGTVPVNADAICAAVPHPVSPETSTDLLVDSAGGRSINVLAPVSQIGKLLGGDFVEFHVADQAGSTCFVSRTGWVSVVPHPQVMGVSQINFAHRRYLAVSGSVEQVLTKLEGKASDRTPTKRRK